MITDHTRTQDDAHKSAAAAAAPAPAPAPAAPAPTVAPTTAARPPPVVIYPDVNTVHWDSVADIVLLALDRATIPPTPFTKYVTPLFMH